MRVAVVGAGAAAVSLLDRLLAHGDRLGDDVAVDLYEPAALAHGVAFGPDLECARINLPNARMSVRYGDPGHFHAWLQARPGAGYLPDDIAAADGYAPRHVYGRYLVEHLRACRAEAAARGWRTTVHAETVVDVLPAPHATTVVTATARRDHTHVVLGTGPGSPADPFALRGSPGFHPDPYPLRTVLPAVGPHDDVLILGTGLTAVDVTLGLLHLGHQGRITMASRRGILPGLRAPGWPGPLTRITAAAVADLAARPHPARPHDILELLGAELREAGWEPAAELKLLEPGVGAAEHLRLQLARVDNPVQAVFMEISAELAAAIRALLPDDERRRLLARFRPHLKSLQCPMPAGSGRQLLAALDRGQLQVVAGLSGVERRGGRYRAATAGPDVTARHVVDATRATPAATTGRARPLMRALAAHPGVSWDAHGGLRVDPVTRRVSGSLFAIGEITGGDVYYASSLPAVRGGAHAVAEAVAADRSRRG